MRSKTTLVLAVAATVLVVMTLSSVFDFARDADHFEGETVRAHRILGVALAHAYAHVARDDGPEQALGLIEHGNLSAEHIDLRWISLAPDAPAEDRSGLDAAARAALLAAGTLFRVTDRGGSRHAITTWVLVERGDLDEGAIRLRESLFVQDEFATTSALRAILAATGAAALAALVVVLFFRLADAQARAEREREQRDEALEQLRHAERLGTVGKLASGVAHELGTPLNVIAGRAKMVATGESNGDSAMSDARIIGEQATRMTEIIRQLLGFARRRAPKREHTDAREVVQKTVSLLRPIAQKSNVELVCESPEQPVAISCDPNQLQQVLSNIIMNAIQAQDSGGQVLVEVKPRNGWVDLSVRDRGPGMDKDTKNRIFEPFFTTKDVGKGTGLGLSVAWGIVREHDGEIDVVSAPGEGTCFTVTMPSIS